MSSSVVPLAPVKITALADAANLSADSIHNLAAVLAVLDYKTDSYDQGLPKWIACANTLGNGFASKSKDLSKALLEVGAWLDFFVECKGGQRNLEGAQSWMKNALGLHEEMGRKIALERRQAAINRAREAEAKLRLAREMADEEEKRRLEVEDANTRTRIAEAALANLKSNEAKDSATTTGSVATSNEELLLRLMARLEARLIETQETASQTLAIATERQAQSETALAESQKALTAANTRIENMREDIESIETSRQSFLAAFEDLSSRVQKLELERQEGQRAFATLEAGLHGAHREIDGVATNVEELRISTATSSSLLDKMQAELAQLRLDLYGTDTSFQPCAIRCSERPTSRGILTIDCQLITWLWNKHSDFD